MAENYRKTSKLYTLGTTGVTTITGASVIHALYNSSNAAATVVIDNSYQIHMASDNHVVFPNPVAFQSVRMFANNTTGVVLYS